MVVAVSESLEVPMTFAALTALGVLAGVVTYGTNGAEIHVRDDWHEATVLYAVTALPSGTRKSATFENLFRPVRAYERVRVEHERADVAKARSQRRKDERRLKTLEESAESDPAAEPDREALAVKLANEAQPVEPRLVADDVTAEKLTALLSEHGGRMILASAEPDLVGLLQGRYSDHGGANLSPFLKGYSGEELCVDRVGGGTIRVPRPLISIVLCSQPDALGSMIADRVLFDRGVVNRFLIAVPRSNLGQRTGTPRPISGAIRANYARVLQGVLAYGSGIYDPTAPVRVVRFAPEALTEVEAFWTENERTLGDAGEFADFSGWASKLPGNVVRIAAVMALTANNLAETIGAEYVRAAIHIGRHFRAHALAAFGAAGLDPDHRRAKRILGHIKRKSLTSFARRELFQCLKGSTHQLVRRASDLDGALDLLEASGHIAREDPDGKRYTVNPLLWNAPGGRK